MTPQQLYVLTNDKHGHTVLSIPRISSGSRIRLSRRGGPLGEILKVEDGNTVAAFKNSGVRTYLLKNFRDLLGV